MLQNYPALVLNADFRPQSIYPLSIKDAWEAIKNVYEGTVAVVAEYDQVVRSPTVTMRIPSVVALRQFVRPPSGRVVFNAANVFLRDRGRCQYCGERGRLTLDQRLPGLEGRLAPMGQRRRVVRSLQLEEGRHRRPDAPDEGAARADRGRAPRAGAPPPAPAGPPDLGGLPAPAGRGGIIAASPGAVLSVT